MAASWSHPGNPLTTIFTPPAGCFENLPQEWSLCHTATDTGFGVYSTSCFWSLPDSCYPAGGVAHTFETGLTYPNKYHYTPGVLPSGFQGIYTVSRGDITRVTGCLPGWNTYAYQWCTSILAAPHTVSGTTATDDFAAVMPQVRVEWQPGDLSLFTPASAPVLPTATIKKYESTVAAHKSAVARSKAAASNPNSKPTSSGSPHKTGSAPAATQSPASPSGLSTGAKAGIGVGVAVGVLILLAIVFVVLWRRRKRGQAEQPRQTESGRLYTDSKSELPINEASKRAKVVAAELPNEGRHELEGRQKPQEVGGNPRCDFIPSLNGPAGYGGTHELP